MRLIPAGSNTCAAFMNTGKLRSLSLVTGSASEQRSDAALQIEQRLG